MARYGQPTEPKILFRGCPIGGAVKRAFRRQISFTWGDAKRKNSLNFSFKFHIQFKNKFFN